MLKQRMARLRQDCRVSPSFGYWVFFPFLPRLLLLLCGSIHDLKQHQHSDNPNGENCNMWENRKEGKLQKLWVVVKAGTRTHR